jgi:hypothetical protein
MPDLVESKELVQVRLYDPLVGVVKRDVATERADPSYARMRLSAMFAGEGDLRAPNAPKIP